MPTDASLALGPVLALVALTFVVWIRMYVVRVGAMRRHRVHAQRLQRVAGDLPPEILGSGDNFRNLCELPVLFYAAAFAALELGAVDRAFLALAWSFVALRVLHSAIHLGYNRVMHRFSAYAAGGLVLWAIWARLGWVLLAR